MSAYNTTLLDEDNNEIYPKTLAENVYDGNTRMDQKVNGIRTDLGNPSSASAVTGADAFGKISKLNSDLASKQIKKTKLSSVAFNNGAGMAYFDWTNKILVSAYEDSGSNAITVTPYNRGNTTTVGFGALVYGSSAFTGTTDIILCYQDIA